MVLHLPKHYKFAILFAGVPGSSKSPIATYLSWNLNLPIFNNDVLRSEYKEDNGTFDVAAYENLRDDRLDELAAKGVSFIYDASVDRQAARIAQWLDDNGYESFVISLDLDKDFIESLYDAKEYAQLDLLDEWYEHHEAFLKEYPEVPDVHITSKEFPKRLQISLDAAAVWIESLEN
jgi:predicted kinase